MKKVIKIRLEMIRTICTDPCVLLISKDKEGKLWKSYDCQSEEDLNDLKEVEV